jgi:hypothetical protein
LKLDLVALTTPLVADSSPAVRREALTSLRFIKSPEAAKVWAQLAAKHDGKDRWYLAAIHSSAQLNWDACLDAYLALVGDKWDTPAGRDIIWTSRATKSADLSLKLLEDEKISAGEKLRYLRAIDYQGTEAQRQAALEKSLQ